MVNSAVVLNARITPVQQEVKVERVTFLSDATQEPISAAPGYGLVSPFTHLSIRSVAAAA